jgi:hypothetical protein
MGGRANRSLGVAALAMLAVLGCSREPSSSRLVVPAGTVEVPVDPALRWVTASTPLRKEPLPAEGAKGNAKAAGVLRTLQRGEQVRLLEERDGAARVRDAEGVEGWVRGSSLLPVEGSPAATVLAEAWAFEQPDLLATNARRRVAPGALLLVRKKGELFTEVDMGSGQNAWVLTDRVTTRPEDLAASRVVERARFLQRSGKLDEARAALASLRQSSPDSPLVAALAVELGELPAEGAGGPSGAPGPGLAPGPAGPTGPPAPAEPSNRPESPRQP